jgi:hypothetical protein
MYQTSSEPTSHRREQDSREDKMTTWALLESPAARPKEIREALIDVLQNKLSALLRQKTRWEGDELRVAFARAVGSTLGILEGQNGGFHPTHVTHGRAHAA